MECWLLFVRTLTRALAGAALLLGTVLPANAQDEPMAAALFTDTVRVSHATGETETDRANVQAAFDAVQPGGTVLFAPGTYRLGAGVRLTIPDVTVLGHSDGTVLRGCNPGDFDEIGFPAMVFECTGLYVQTERQTIRGLTFEYTWHGIVVGPYPTTLEGGLAMMQRGEYPDPYPAGGQRIEGNTFRASPNGLRIMASEGEVSVVRDNDFIDVFHAIGINGAPVHFLDNRVTVEEPESVPFSRHPGSAINVAPHTGDCAGNVIAGNRIEGNPGAIYVLAYRGETCRDVTIRDNIIEVRRARIPEAWMFTPTAEDSTLVGMPIALVSLDILSPGGSETVAPGLIENVIVERNRVIGADGLGVMVEGSRNRIVGNTITGVRRRVPFPGIPWMGTDEIEPWEAANGSGIWVSGSGEANEIMDNVFDDIAGASIFLEGSNNRVEVQIADNTVRDLGSGNRVTQQSEDR